MRYILSAIPRVVLLMAVAEIGAVGVKAQCLPGGLAVVVNKANPTESLSIAQLRKLILGDVRTWPDNKPVLLVTPEASSEVFKCVLSSVVRMSDAEYRRYVLGAEFRGAEPLATRTANSGPAAGRIVATLPGSLGVVEASALPSLAGVVRVVRIGGKEPGQAGYPL